MYRYSKEQLVRALRWSEKYTGTDMVYLARGSFWLSSSSIITAAVSFLLALAFANLLTQHDYGVYKYILTLFGIFCVACLRGMDTAVTQGAARGNDGTVMMGLWAKMRWSLLGSLGALCGAAYYFYNGNDTLGTGLIFAAFFIPFMEPFGIFNAVLVGKKDFKLSSILGVLGQIAAAAALIATLFFTDNPIIIFAVYASAWTLTRYISLQITLRKFPSNDTNEPGALSYALHSSAINASNIVISSLDAILVFHYLGAAELALFAFAMAPVSHLRTIVNTPTILALPKLAGQSTAAIKSILMKRTGVLFILGAGITLAYCLLAYPFYFIFFPQYIEAVPLSLFFSITILLQVGTALVGAAIDSRVTLIPRRLLYLWNIPSIIAAISALLLIKTFGLWGAVAGQVLTYAASCVITWYLWYAIRNKEHTSS
ncbi:MAG: oligosaccharide flippase family protein [Patescibacteria group bacterium]